MSDDRSTAATQRRARLLLTAALALYGIPCLMRPGSGRILDAVDLAIHETGHLVFAPFGECISDSGACVGSRSRVSPEFQGSEAGVS